MEGHGLNFSDFIVNQVCPENNFLEEMETVIHWWEIEAWLIVIVENKALPLYHSDLNNRKKSIFEYSLSLFKWSIFKL